MFSIGKWQQTFNFCRNLPLIHVVCISSTSISCIFTYFAGRIYRKKQRKLSRNSENFSSQIVIFLLLLRLLKVALCFKKACLLSLHLFIKD